MVKNRDNHIKLIGGKFFNIISSMILNNNFFVTLYKAVENLSIFLCGVVSLGFDEIQRCFNILFYIIHEVFFVTLVFYLI